MAIVNNGICAEMKFQRCWNITFPTRDSYSPRVMLGWSFSQAEWDLLGTTLKTSKIVPFAMPARPRIHLVSVVNIWRQTPIAPDSLPIGLLPMIRISSLGLQRVPIQVVCTATRLGSTRCPLRQTRPASFLQSRGWGACRLDKVRSEEERCKVIKQRPALRFTMYISGAISYSFWSKLKPCIQICDLYIIHYEVIWQTHKYTMHLNIA